MTKEELALAVIERLKQEYPDADCTLDYDQAWKLLVSVRLAAQCTDARVNVVVEDLYRPYKPKRRTRATIAKEKGLEPLAGIITLQMLNTSLEEEAEKFVDPEKEVMSAEDAIAGAKDIIAESISDEADYRSRIRDLTVKKGRMISAAKDPEAESVYEMYYEFEEPIKKLAGHLSLIHI